MAAVGTPSDPTAVIGRRVAAAIVDLLVVVVPVFLLATAQFEYVTRDTWRQDQPDIAFADACDVIDGDVDACVVLGDRAYFARDPSQAPTAVGIALSFALLVLLQGLTGRTPGKLLTGLRTVREDGRPPGIGRAALRWLLLIVDNLPCVPLVGFITALTTKGHRRVGDMAAKTFVVRASAAGSPVLVPGVTAPEAATGYARATSAPSASPSPGWAPPAKPPVEPPAQPGGWAPPSGTPAGEPPADQPRWDEARGTYIQWDPARRVWLQWDERSRTWTPIPEA